MHNEVRAMGTHKEVIIKIGNDPVFALSKVPNKILVTQASVSFEDKDWALFDRAVEMAKKFSEKMKDQG